MRRQMPAHNGQFVVIVAVAGRNGSANLKHCIPQEV